MMKNKQVVVLAFAVGVGSLSVRPCRAADPGPPVRIAIQAALDRSSAAYQRRDLTGYMAAYGIPCQSVSVTGRVSNYYQIQASVAQYFAAPGKKVAFQWAVKAVRLQGGVANALVACVEREPHAAAKGKPAYLYTRRTLSTQTWTHGARGWRLMRDQLLQDTFSYQRPTP